MQPFVLEREQRVPYSLERVFPFFGTPENLETITPPELRFQILTPSPIEMGKGALFDYFVTTRGVPVRWTTLITNFDPPRSFIDTQIRGPYSFWHHTHTFHEENGETVIRDVVRYILPLGPLGVFAHWLFVRNDLEKIFDYRREVIAKEFPAK